MIVYGTVCLDRFRRHSDSKEEAVAFPGGEAFNTAAALAGWGVPVLLTGTAVGDDPEGLLLRHLLRSHPLAAGIDISLVPFVSGAVTPVCDIHVDERGERTMQGRGFKQATSPDLNTLLPYFNERVLFTIDPNLGEAAMQAARTAKNAGCKIVSMDFAAFPEILAISQIAITSVEWITRSSTTDCPSDGVKAMLHSSAGAAIVTRGKDGGILALDDAGKQALYAYTAAPIPDAETIVDTTGAGDTFRSGVCHQLFRGESLESAVRFGSAAAALHCTTLGGASRFPLHTVQSLAKFVRIERLPADQSKT